MSPLPDFFLGNPVTRDFRISEHFNAPRNYTFAPTKKQLHEGVDIVAIDAQGNPVGVLAAQRGVIDKVGFAAEGYGNYVRIVHDWNGEKWVTWYGHMSSITVQAGQFVLAGQKLGIAGTTGFSTGIHLHLTLQRIGRGLSNYTVDDAVDPEPFFRLAPVVYDEATFVADVTLPDDTLVQPGQALAKTWRVRNTGTTLWDAGYRLVFAGQEKMGGPDDVALPVVPVQPGQVINLTVNLSAPTAVGTHRSAWQMRNARGDLFPNSLFAQVKIKEVKPFDEASYVADVTIPDGTVVQPGQGFDKTWRVRNSGTTTWGSGYSLRFVGDEALGGPGSVALPRAIKPGEIVDLSVALKAPAGPGRHRSTWKLHNAQGKPFDYEQYVEIQVPKQAAPTHKLSEMTWVADVTIPDETPLPQGEKFVKTWRIRNSGETTWGPGYTLAFFGDDKMGGPDNIPLPAARPGDTVEVSLTLTAPERLGSRRSTWKPRDPQGNVFEFDLFTLITVTARKQPVAQVNEMSWVADVTIPDGTVVAPGQKFLKTWRVRNTGTTTWGAGYALAFFDGDKMGGPDSIPLPAAKPGDVVDLSLMLTAPAAQGMQKSAWKGRDAQNRSFEYDLFALIDVVDPVQTVDMLPFLQGDGRLYELDNGAGGRLRLQAQTAGSRFYLVKNSEWEELWTDDRFVYRGADTSSGGGEVAILTENGQYGSAWLPRQMRVGVPFRRTPRIVFRRKDTGAEVPNKQFAQVTHIVLEAVHSKFRLSSGIELADVAVLATFEDDGGKPKAQPLEHYYYAKKYGLVGREGPLGRSALVREFTPGSQPDNQRETLPWLDQLSAGV